MMMFDVVGFLFSFVNLWSCGVRGREVVSPQDELPMPHSVYLGLSN
jgi:hypothetical protein